MIEPSSRAQRGPSAIIYVLRHYAGFVQSEFDDLFAKHFQLNAKSLIQTLSSRPERIGSRIYANAEWRRPTPQCMHDRTQRDEGCTDTLPSSRGNDAADSAPVE